MVKPAEQVHQVARSVGVGTKRRAEDVAGSVAPALVPIVRPVGGERSSDGFAEQNDSLALLLDDDVGGGLAHHVDHVQRAVHLQEQCYIEVKKELAEE